MLRTKNTHDHGFLLFSIYDFYLFESLKSYLSNQLYREKEHEVQIFSVSEEVLT